MGVHGGQDDLATSIANVNKELEKSWTLLNKISGVKIPALPGFGGGSSGGPGFLKLGNVPGTPGPATGQSGQMVNPMNVAFGGVPKWMTGLGIAKAGITAGIGMAAIGREFLPSTTDSVAMQSMLHQMGTRQNVYGGAGTRQGILNNVMGGIDKYAVGGRDEPMMAAFTMSSAGIQNQSFLRTMLSQNQGMAMMTQMPNSQVAQAQVGFHTGQFAARALSFGIPTADLGTGNMKNDQQILETMYKRMMVRGIKPTAENVQESYLRGAVGANFRALGMSQEQQQIALQYFTERAKQGRPIDLANVQGLEKMGYNKDNNYVMAEWSKNKSQLTLMSKTFDKMAEGSKIANDALKGFYDTLSNIPQPALDKFAKSIGVLETALSDKGVASAIGGITGALSGLFGLLGVFAASGLVKSLLRGAGGFPGAGKSGKIGPAPTGPSYNLPAPNRLSKFAKLGKLGKLGKVGGLLGFGIEGAVLGYQNRKSYEDILGGIKNKDADQFWSGMQRNAEFAAQHINDNNPLTLAQDSAVGSVNFIKSIFSGGASPMSAQYSHSNSYGASGSHWKAGHRGIDYNAPQGAAVFAAAGGRVISLGSDAGWAGAQAVKIKGSDGYYYVYGHLASNRVSKGDTVREGQRIGSVGSLGNSTGPHLHFEVRTGPDYGSDVDPRPFTKGKRPTATAGGATGSALVNFAKKFIGTPYVAGGRSPKGWDCAGFTWYVAKHFGIEIGQVSEAQLKKGSKVAGVKNAKPGDLFIWRKKGTRGIGADGHVAMYVGGGRVIHAHGGAGGTTNITSLAAAVPSSHYLAGIRRIAGGGAGVGAALASQIGSGTPEASGTTDSGAVSGSLVDVAVSSTTGMVVTARTLAETIGSSGASGASSIGAGNGTVAGSQRSDKGIGVGQKVSGSSNRAKVWNMLTGEGFSAKAAAGIIGNLMQESGVNPNSSQSGGPGRGIMQWSAGERWASLQKWSHSKGLKARDLETQVQFMIKEMKDYGVLGKMKRMDDVNDATLFFENKMERAGSPNMENRYKYAREALRQFGRGSYSQGSRNIPMDEDARVHAGEMILTATQAEAVRKEAAGVLSGQRKGGNTFHIHVPNGTTEEQAQMIARRVAAILDEKSATTNLMEV